MERTPHPLRIRSWQNGNLWDELATTGARVTRKGNFFLHPGSERKKKKEKIIIRKFANIGRKRISLRKTRRGGG